MKHMRLMALFIAAMMMQPAYAGPKMERAKNFGTVGWHCAKVVAGWKLWQIGWKSPVWDTDDKWIIGTSLFLLADGLSDLKTDLHKHMFHHLDSWWNYKSKNAKE